MKSEGVAIGHINLNQNELTTPWSPVRQYDFVMGGLSWESRASYAFETMSDGRDQINLIKFVSRDDSVEQMKSIVYDKFKNLFHDTRVIPLAPSVGAHENFQMLEQWFRDKYVSIGRPMRVLMDITCIPKTYILFILGLGFTRDYLACFDCLYSPGLYDLSTPNTEMIVGRGGPRAILSEGEWHSRQIPYLEPRNIIASDRDLIVTLGGELGLSLPFIEKFEPRRLGLIYIKERCPDRPAPMLASERSALDDLLREPNVQRADIDLCDARGAAQHAMDFARLSTAGTVTGVAIGSKPHALGIGLAALADKKLEVVCRTPASYRAADVKPDGRLFAYQIADRFEPFSYL